MRSTRGPISLKTAAALAGLLALTVLMIVLGVRVAGLAPRVIRERNATPTPAPLYGSVLAVTPDPDAPTAAPATHRGSQGEEVTRLQQRLAELGYYQGTIDGQFGGGTESAVMQFQLRAGLTADGWVGPETSARLFAADAPAADGPEAVVTPAPTAVPAPAVTPTPAAAVPAGARRPYVRPDGLPLVVNRQQPLPDGYATWQLVEMNAYCDSRTVKIKYKETYAEKEAVDALMVMLTAARADGVGDWQISAAYRDTAYQQRLFDNKVNSYIKEKGYSRSKAVSAARQTVADPGTSEHHLGTCFDITVPGKSFSGTKQYKWIAVHCWEYGFIQRYTKEKSKITGFAAEAWHYRWVGKEHAEIMHRENLCLEEYVARYGVEIE